MHFCTHWFCSLCVFLTSVRQSSSDSLQARYLATKLDWPLTPHLMSSDGDFCSCRRFELLQPTIFCRFCPDSWSEERIVRKTAQVLFALSNLLHWLMNTAMRFRTPLNITVLRLWMNKCDFNPLYFFNLSMILKALIFPVKGYLYYLITFSGLTLHRRVRWPLSWLLSACKNVPDYSRQCFFFLGILSPGRSDKYNNNNSNNLLTSNAQVLCIYIQMRRNIIITIN